MCSSDLSSAEDPSQIALLANFDDAKKKQLDTIAERRTGYQKQIDDLNSYMNGSILMNLDWTNVSEINLQYYIKAADGTPSDTQYLAMQNYKAVLQSSTFYDAATGSLNTSTSNLSELVTVKILSSYDSEDAAGNIDQTGDQVDINLFSGNSAGILYVHIIGPDSAFCNTAAQAVDQTIQNAKNEIAQKAGGHDIFLLSSTASEIADSDVQKAQLSAANAVLSINNAKTELTSELSGTELQYVNALLNTASNAATASTASSSLSIKSIVKYGFVGLLGGFFLSALFLCIQYLHGSRVSNAYLLEDQYLTHNYLMTDSSRKHHTRLDTRIENARYRYMHVYSPADLSAVLAAEIESRQNDHAIHSIFVGSSRFTDFDRKFIDELSALLKEKSIAITSGDQISYHPDLIRPIMDSDLIILMETMGSSLIPAVDETVKYLSEKNKTVTIGITSLQ